MKTYKVWVEVEEYDDSSDKYTKIGDPFCAGVFDTFEEAVSYAGCCSTTLVVHPVKEEK